MYRLHLFGLVIPPFQESLYEWEYFEFNVRQKIIFYSTLAITAHLLISGHYWSIVILWYTLFNVHSAIVKSRLFRGAHAIEKNVVDT